MNECSVPRAGTQAVALGVSRYPHPQPLPASWRGHAFGMTARVRQYASDVHPQKQSPY